MQQSTGSITAAAWSGGMTSESSGTAIPPKRPGMPVLDTPVSTTTGMAIA